MIYEALVSRGQPNAGRDGMASSTVISNAWIGTAALTAAATSAYAGFHHLYRLADFAGVLRMHRLFMGRRTAMVAAALLALWEVGGGLTALSALVWRSTLAPAVFLSLTLLYSGYAAHLWRLVWRGYTGPCGCVGESTRVSAVAVVRAAALAVASAVAAAVSAPSMASTIAWDRVLVVSMAALSVTIIVVVLPDALVNPWTKPGAKD